MPLALASALECPVCAQVIGPWPRGITLHARHHGLTSQDVYDRVHGIAEPPTCQCSPTCEEAVKWLGWEGGYREYVRGHFSAGLVERRTQSRLESYAAGKHLHWTHRPENRHVLERSGRRASAMLKARFMDGTIEHWAMGHTKETHPALARHVEGLRGSRHRLYEAHHVVELIRERLGDRFELLANVDTIAQRDNNRSCYVDIRCVECEATSQLSVYNIVRKAKQWCRSCDPASIWSSQGEAEVATLLATTFGEVKRWVWVNGWSIDMYVPSCDAYVQFDGVYWHGLDRPIEMVKDPKIVRKYYRDVEQVAWFSAQGLKLVRITEVEWQQTDDRRALLVTKIGA